MDRRAFIETSLALTAAAAMPTCTGIGSTSSQYSDGRLTARPSAPTKTAASGQTTLGGGSRPDGFLYVPANYVPATALPLVVSLHGAGGSASGPLNLLSAYADELHFLQLSINSRGPTWDAIRGGYGPDIEVIDRSLRYVFDHCAVRPEYIVLEGFSDGASYAIGAGITNGDLFTRIIAFSPGFVTANDPHGKPPFYISHGVQDPILPIDNSSRVIVPQLRTAGYAVDYHEFDGVHQVPADIAREAMLWMTT
jgi:poly(3-hydroxybutyrate) depolymerase